MILYDKILKTYSKTELNEMADPRTARKIYYNRGTIPLEKATKIFNLDKIKYTVEDAIKDYNIDKSYKQYKYAFKIFKKGYSIKGISEKFGLTDSLSYQLKREINFTSKAIKGDFGKLYTYGVKVTNYHNPKWFLAENVPGLIATNNGKDFEKIIKELSTAGSYGGYISTPHLYQFEEYGVPQFRSRIIIVEIRKDFNLKFKVPAPTTKDKYISSKEALSNIPRNAFNHEFPIHKKML